MCLSAWFHKGGSCLTNLVAFYDDITVSVDKETAPDAIYLEFIRSLIWSLFIHPYGPPFSSNWKDLDLMSELFNG